MLDYIKSTNFLSNYSAFMLAGFPSFLLAIFLNWIMVEYISFDKLISYAIIQILQVVINFFMCKIFVFKKNKNRIINQFIKFSAGIILFRILDWSFYTLIIFNTDIHFIIIQISNTIIFSIMKFFYSKRVLEKK